MGLFDLIGDVIDSSKCLINPYDAYKQWRLSRWSFTDNCIYDRVTPKIGSVVVCDLTPLADHTGIYVGGGKIIHRDGDGYIAKVTPKQFLERLDGLNTAISVYVSSYGDESIGYEGAAERANEALRNSDYDGYNLLWKNCHNFTSYCIRGGSDSSIFASTFTALEEYMWNFSKFNNWRVWNF